VFYFVALVSDETIPKLDYSTYFIVVT